MIVGHARYEARNKMNNVHEEIRNECILQAGLWYELYVFFLLRNIYMYIYTHAHVALIHWH